MFAKCNPEGFESIDITNYFRWDDWRKVMAAEQMHWLQLGDKFSIKGMSPKLTTKFGLVSIPWYVPLDKEGKILACTSSKQQID